MTEQATPRPWRLTLHPDLTEISADEIPNGAPRPVPVVSWPGFDDSFRSRAQHNANAALIVQAVNAYDDMRAALQRLLAPMASWGGCSYCAPGFGAQWHDLDCPVVAARAAIAKATGGQP